MSAPFLWIFLPLAMAILLLVLRKSKFATVSASLLILILTLAAWMVPIDEVIRIGRLTFKLLPSFEILGRSFTLTSADRSFLALIYGSTFFWFAPSALFRISQRLIPFGLAITSMLVAAIAVEPFLYAALIIELAVILSMPLLTAQQIKPSKGVLRFLIIQTLAVPFILFSGWLLAGIEANPADPTLVQQTAILLGFGFAFLLAIIPFFSWIPMLAEESHPFVVGFLLWLLPTTALFFGLGFLDRYSWLRDAPSLPIILTTVGILMVVSGGLLSAFQRHLGRIMGYAVIVETGVSLLALSMENKTGLLIFLFLLVPRTLCLCLWSLSLSVLKVQASGLNFKDIKGMGRSWPFAASGVILANLALAGLPLLVGFPAHQAVWEGLANNSLSITFWAVTGSLGLIASALRSLFVLFSIPEDTTWGIHETQLQRLLIGIGLLSLFVLGLVPQLAQSVWTGLPAIFEHLGQ